MDSESPQQSQLQQEKVEVVAQQMLKAFNTDTQSEPNIIVFLSKLYKNNSSLKNKKMKSIRLNQFISFLQYVSNDFPTTKEDTQLLYCSVVSTLINDKNFSDFQDYELIESVGYQIAKVIEKLSETQFPSLALKLLSHLINSENISSSLMEIPAFDETLKNSKYFQTINLDQTHHSHHHAAHQHKWHILEQPSIFEIILDGFSVQKVYANLFKAIEEKFTVVCLFYQHLKKLTLTFNKSRRQLFIECFITSQETLTICQAEAILKIMQKQVFDRETINEVVGKITEEKIPLQQLIEIDFKKIKGVEDVFVQCLLQQSSKKSINEVIGIFLGMKSEDNYFPLYLILKLNKKIPVEYVKLFLQDNKVFTIRRGIIFTLAIVDNELSSFEVLMRQFLRWNASDRIRTRKDYDCVLKAIHFSLQNVSKSNVVSHILRYIHKQNLNKQCGLQFIGYNVLKVSSQQEMKSLLNEQIRDGLSVLFKVLSQFQGMTKSNIKQGISVQQGKREQYEHKFRMDLQFTLSSNPELQEEISSSIKQLNKLLQGNVNIQELLRQLPSIKQNLLEVTLMWINNKYETFYQQQTNQQTVDWAVKMYKKLSADLNNQLTVLLEKEKLQLYTKLIKTLIDFTIERQLPLNFNIQPHNNNNNKIFHTQIIQLINSSLLKQQRMNSNNFNDYFLTQSAYKNYISQNNHSKIYKKIIWIKTLLIETKQLLKNIIKAEKLGNRKQIKNIVSQNIADVLAFKIIHQYFDSELQQTPEILIEVFRTIQPEIQFFEKTQALASSLNIEFYSIFEELPNLLENFNSDTLIFLSKLIFNNPKNTAEDKKKTTKKKKQKENQPEDSLCLNVIVKNFQLLFGDPNQMESFKSLFVILRKLVDSQKINKDLLEKHLNNWLGRINFISCSNLEIWKNKVMSLSKMWKNAADLLSDKKIEKKFQLIVLQKHFNLFTDLLNKLYENFRQDSQFLEIQQRILLSLCLIYKKQDFSEIIEEQNSMVDFIIKRFQQKNMSRIVLDNKFYFCYQCKKSACYACSSFLHRNHDKIFTGKAGICEHQVNGSHKSKRQTLLKNQYTASIYGGVSAILKKNEDLPEQVLERISQKLLLEQQLRANEDGDYIGRFRDPQAMRQLLEGRIPKSKAQRSEEIKKKIREKESQYKNELKKQEQEDIEEDEKTMTPQAQQYFQYKESYCKEFKKIHSQFKYQPPKMSKVVPKINTSPLARVFLRQLQQNHFYNQETNDKQLQNSSGQSIRVEQMKEKYLFFKNSNLKSDNSRDYTFGRGRGGYGGGFNYGQNPRDNPPLSQQRRNVIACNKKYLLIPYNLSLMNLSMPKIKQKLEKKIQNKEYSQTDQQKNYVCCPPVNLPYQIMELAFSSSVNNPCLAIVGSNQVCFYPINADGRFGRQLNPQYSRMDNITKFCWINEKKNLYAISFSNYIRIGGISSGNSVRAFSKAQIGKAIRDFDGHMNSRTYVLFILDTDGKLYYIDVDFKEGKSTAYSPHDKIISLKDEDGNIIKEEIYAVKSIDGNRLLISFPNGVIRVAQTNRESNIWSTKKLDLKKIMKLESMLVLQAIKIVKFSEQCVILGAIGRKLNAFENIKTRKCSGQLMIINFNLEDNNLSSVFYTKEQNIQSYDCTLISSGQLIVSTLNDQGALHVFKHMIQSQNKQIVQRIGVSIDIGSVRVFCRKLIGSDFFSRVQQGGMLRNLQFKQNKCINGEYSINNKRQLIVIKQSYGYSNFISGILFQVQLPSSITEYNNIDDNNNNSNSNKRQQWIVLLRVKLLQSQYVFRCSSKSREVQLGLNVKESLLLFCSSQSEVNIEYQVEFNKEVVDVSKLSEKEVQEFVRVKNVQIYGYQAKDLYFGNTNNNNNNNNNNTEINNTHHPNQNTNPYINAFRQLFTQYHIYQQYNKDSFQQYLLNPYRHDFHNIDIKKLYKLKYDQSSTPFKSNHINLLLKLELFSQTLISNDKHYTKQNIQEYIISLRKLLLNKQYPRKSLENSLYRLAYSLSDLYMNYVPLTQGHPYHAQSLINLHCVVVSYQKWQIKKNLSTFDSLCTILSDLILTSAVTVHIILQSIPELIIQLSSYFKQLITGHKQKQFSQDQSQVSITKTCSRFIGILCEYYQVMKNKSINKIQENILYLLQQVFGQCKREMPKQLVMNPFLYLESIFSIQQQTEIQSVIDIYSIDLRDNSIDIRYNSIDIRDNCIDLRDNNTYINKLQQQGFYHIERLDKLRKQAQQQQNVDQMIKQQQHNINDDEIKQQQQQRLLQQNRRWQAIQQQKDMDQEDNQMYMEIEQQFDDQQQEDGLPPMMGDVEHLDLQSRKDHEIINKHNTNVNQPQPIIIVQKDLQQTISKTILTHAFTQIKHITINHYDFPIELAIALFSKQTYLNQTNIYFYLGLLYNLLKIIENNIAIINNNLSKINHNKTYNKHKIIQFVQTVNSRITNPQYSSLFIVLNFFISPKYHKKTQNTQYTLQKPQSSLSEYFTQYYKQNQNRFISLLTTYNPKICHPVTKLAQIMRFSKFETKNQLYNLRFISNLYLTYRLLGNSFIHCQQNLRIKEELLFKLVKHKLPVLKNIMLYQKWQQQLDRAKVLVSFEMILSSCNNSEQKQKGIDMLYECAHQKPQKFVQQLLKDENKVIFLEEYSLNNQELNQKTQTQLLQLLEVYYNA